MPHFMISILSPFTSVLAWLMVHSHSRLPHSEDIHCAVDVRPSIREGHMHLVREPSVCSYNFGTLHNYHRSTRMVALDSYAMRIADVFVKGRARWRRWHRIWALSVFHQRTFHSLCESLMGIILQVRFSVLEHVNYVNSAIQ